MIKGINEVDHSDPHIDQAESLPEVRESSVIKWYPACPNCSEPQSATADQMARLRRTSTISRNVVCKSCGQMSTKLSRRMHISIIRD